MNAQEREWRKNPPASVLIASYLGFKPLPDPDLDEDGVDMSGVQELINMFPDGNITIG